MQKILASVRLIHIFTLRERKALRQLPTGVHLEEIINSKIISKSDMKKERCDLRRAISNLHQSCPWAAMSSLNWHNSHICGWQFQLALTAAALQGLSLEGMNDVFTICQTLWPNMAFQERNIFVTIKS